MSSVAMSSQTTLSAPVHHSELIHFTAGMDFLSPRERARFHRRAARAYRRAERNAQKCAEAEGCATPKLRQSMCKPLPPIPVGPPPSCVLPATPRSSHDVPQVCAFRLVSLAEAQVTIGIRYHGII